MSIEERILNTISLELEIPVQELRQEDSISMGSLPEWDSLKHSSIILALEKEFDRTFDVARASQATNVDALTALVNEP